MKQQDFERLKAVCEKEGFEYKVRVDALIITKKKDAWEGVEYFEGIDGKIRPINNDFREFVKSFSNSVESLPSTQQAYIDQLKKEAFERFGEIKEGDRFVEPDGNKWDVPNGGFSKCNPEWEYDKCYDALYYYSLTIYQSGKWATKLPKRIEVDLNRHHWTGEPNGGYNFNFKFRIKSGGENTDMCKTGQFLASQLEKYLNGEIE